jgi:hypothetical protein
LGTDDPGIPVRTVCEQRENLHPSGALVLDEDPMCYWNIEADRIEMLPSRLEIIIAEDAGDPSVIALDNVLGHVGAGALGFELGSETFCRNGNLEPFINTGNVSGVLGPFVPPQRE